MAHIALPRPPGQLTLCCGFTRPHQAAHIERQLQGARQGTGDLNSLVEPALCKALPRERHRHDNIPGRVRTRQHARRQKVGAGETATELEHQHQSISRERILPGGERRVEGRRLGKTDTASCCCVTEWCRADLATWQRQRRQIGAAGGAERLLPGLLATQQASLGQQYRQQVVQTCAQTRKN